MPFAIRTVRNGTVKIHGKIFRVVDPHREYKGELDGQRFAFGLYKHYAPEQGEFVSLWGTQEYYRHSDDPESAESTTLWLSQPNFINGKIHWLWWCDDVNIEWHRQCRIRTGREAA